jgi:hypothetical protein
MICQIAEILTDPFDFLPRHVTQRELSAQDHADRGVDPLQSAPISLCCRTSPALRQTVAPGGETAGCGGEIMTDLIWPIGQNLVDGRE